MKKILLLAAAFFVATASFAQENLAIGGTATATAVNEANTADKAIDGDTGTRWEAPASHFADGNEEVEWNLELKEESTFNTIQILWEGAYSKSFVISVSKDNKEYTDIYTETDKTLEGLPVLQTYKLGNDVTAKYIKFKNTARGSIHGVSFFEFRVFKTEAAVLTSIVLSSSATLVKVGTSVDLTAVLTAIGKDQIGETMPLDNVTYEIASGGGTIYDNKFTPTQAGEVKIVAKSGNITSNEITYYVHSNDKIAINTEKVTLIGEGTVVDNNEGIMANAFDDDLGSPWKLHANTDNTDEARTYETGFLVDLDGTYDITDVHIKFEGACPADYTVSFSADGETYVDEKTVTDHAGMATFTDFFQSDATSVKYVKFRSTKAATPWGVKIFDFSIYGTESTGGDTEAPTWANENAVVVSNITATSVTLTVNANDDKARTLTYTVEDKANSFTKEFTGTANGETSVEIEGLTAETEYTFSISVKDKADNVSAEVKTVTFTTEPNVTSESLNPRGTVKISGTVKTLDALNKLFSDVNTTAYNIAELAIDENIKSFEVANPNAMIQVSDAQATQFANMNNLFEIDHTYFFPRNQYVITDGYPVYTDFYISTGDKGYKYTREIPAGKYVATTLPVEVSLPAGISAYEFGSVDNNVYTFNKIAAEKKLAANTPYILYSANGKTLEVSGTSDLNMTVVETVTSTDGKLIFHGNYKTFAGDGSQYGLFNNSDENSIVLKSVNGGTIGAFRGYFTVNTTSDAKDIRFIFNNGGTDGISSVNSETTVNAANVYTIDGRFVNNNGSVAGLAKGLYIVGGKKVIVK